MDLEVDICVKIQLPRAKGMIESVRMAHTIPRLVGDSGTG
jgi:hypothetical protein